VFRTTAEQREGSPAEAFGQANLTTRAEGRSRLPRQQGLWSARMGWRSLSSGGRSPATPCGATLTAWKRAVRTIYARARERCSGVAREWVRDRRSGWSRVLSMPPRSLPSSVSSWVYEHAAAELRPRRLGSGPRDRLRFDLEKVDSWLSSCSGGRGSEVVSGARGSAESVVQRDRSFGHTCGAAAHKEPPRGPMNMLNTTRRLARLAAAEAA
jgi:hypothetical protein